MSVDKVGGPGGGGWWESIIRKVRPITPAKPADPVKPEAPLYDSKPLEDYSLENITPEQAKKLRDDHDMALSHPPFEKYGLKRLRDELEQVAAGADEGRRFPTLEHAGIAINAAIERASGGAVRGAYPDSYAVRLFNALNAAGKALAETLGRGDGTRAPT